MKALLEYMHYGYFWEKNDVRRVSVLRGHFLSYS